MLRIVLIVVVCVYGLVSASYAQPSAKFGLGIKGGATLSTVYLDSESDDVRMNSRFPWLSYHAGIFGLLKIGILGIQPEVLFSSQGSDFRTTGTSLISSYNYVNVPLVFKLYPLLGLNIQVGPQFGFVVSAYKDRLDPSTGNISSEDIKDEFKQADIGLTAGLGWDFPFGLSIGVRYNIGFTNVFKESSTLPDEKNHVFQASLGYRLVNFGKE